MKASTAPRWIDLLGDDDLGFLKRFVLASGSLKDLATTYGVTYPTIRLRLDRLIQKITILSNEEFGDPFEKRLHGLYVSGKLDKGTFEELLAAYRKGQNHEG